MLDPPNEMYNSRVLKVVGGPEDAKFKDLDGYPKLARPLQREDDTRYYGFGLIAVEGCLFQFLNTYNRPLRAGELERPDLTGSLLRHVGCKLIYSPDGGRTWHNQDGSTPVVWEQWEQRSCKTMLFFEEEQEAFSMLSPLQMGRDYQQNRDGYLYVYAPNGNTEGTMNELVMFRVPKAQIRHRHAYEYFAGLESRGSAKWSADLSARKPVHTFPPGWVGKLLHPFSWHPSVVYNAGLDVYLMVNWGTGNAPGGEAWFTKPSYLGFWAAPEPWGPWTQIHEEPVWTPQGDPAARCYQPQIPPKWIAADGKSFWLVWTDYQVVGDGAALQRLAEERKQAGYPSAWTEDFAVRYVTAMRNAAPYYSFNVQRVDLILG